MARLRDLYKSKVVEELKKEFNYKNPMAIPRMNKVVISMGLGKALQDKKYMEMAIKDLTKISGQKPVQCRAKKSVSNFKVRAGEKTGLKVTLRGNRMYEFMDRLINLAIPRVRDFRGISKTAFDGRGNYSVGVKEQLIFPEIKYDDIETIRGMNVVFTTTAETDEEARELLSLMGMPFKK